MKQKPESVPLNPKERDTKVSGNSSKKLVNSKLNKRREDMKKQESDQELVDFLYSRNMTPDWSNLDKLEKSLIENRLVYPGFSPYDFSEEELGRIFGTDESIKSKEELKDRREGQLIQANSAEKLVDELQQQGLSKTDVIRELLEAHDSNQIKLLPEKYARFQSLLELLDQKAFGSETDKLAEIINGSDVDLSTPQAFEQILSIVMEDDSLSEKTKRVLTEKFGLKPIVLGSDLKDNLVKTQNYNRKLKKQRLELIRQVGDLEKQIKAAREELNRFKEKILAEKDFEQKAVLEKGYDALEEHLIALLHQKSEAQIADKELKDQKRTETLFIHGCEAKITEGEIVVKIPETPQTIKFPLESSAEHIAECVNVFLLYQQFQPLGISETFFGSLDLSGQLVPQPSAIKRMNRFSAFSKLSNTAYIFPRRKLSKLAKLMNGLINPDQFDSKLSDQENGTNRLKSMNLFPLDDLTMDRLMRRLWWIKVFGI